MESSWKHISEISDISQINTIICDTRDFYCNTFNDIRKFDKVPDESLIPASDILKWISEVEEVSGGKGQWRCLVFENVDCKGWLKYIRFYRYPAKSEMFVVCNGYDIPINWKNCTKENLDEEVLWIEK